jgi:hypothetical protein
MAIRQYGTRKNMGTFSSAKYFFRHYAGIVIQGNHYNLYDYRNNLAERDLIFNEVI